MAELKCIDCGVVITGRSHKKRCAACKIKHKRIYERLWRRKWRSTKPSQYFADITHCLLCGKALDKIKTKWCDECRPKAILAYKRGHYARKKANNS